MGDALGSRRRPRPRPSSSGSPDGPLADPIVSVLLSLLILVGAWRLLRESSDILLDSVPGHVSMRRSQRRMLGVPGVTGVHDLHVWTVVSGVVAMSGHAIVPDLEAIPACSTASGPSCPALGIAHVTIQLEMARRVRGGPRGGRSSSAAPTGHRHGERHGIQSQLLFVTICWTVEPAERVPQASGSAGAAEPAAHAPSGARSRGCSTSPDDRPSPSQIPVPRRAVRFGKLLLAGWHGLVYICAAEARVSGPKPLSPVGVRKRIA